MKRLELATIALAAAMLSGCSVGETTDEAVTAAQTPVATSPEATAAATTTVAPTPAAATAAAVTPETTTSKEEVARFNAHIDASAFLNSLVESGCQIDKAEYKEVKRGGAIKVVCSKAVDALNVELDDL